MYLSDGYIYALDLVAPLIHFNQIMSLTAANIETKQFLVKVSFDTSFNEVTLSD